MITHQENDSEKCPECHLGGCIIEDHLGTLICKECGLVVNDSRLDTEHPEKRFYNKSDYDKKARTGQPITDLTPSMTFLTLTKKREAKTPQQRRMITWDNQIKWKERGILLGISEIKRIATTLPISHSTKGGAVKLFKRSSNKKLLKGRSVVGIASASLYIQCRINQDPVSIEDIVEETIEKITSKKIIKFYRAIVKEFRLKLPPPNISRFVARYVNELGLGAKAESYASNIIKDLTSMYHSGKDPKGIIGGVIYLIAKLIGMNRTQKEIAKKLRVTEVTVRSRYKEIERFIDEKKINIRMKPKMI
jgi:transcription initiation factor TFIIB